MPDTRIIYTGLALNTAEQLSQSAAGKSSDPHYWQKLLEQIDGKTDFVTLEDHFGTPQGGLDATLLACHLAPHVRQTGLIAGAVLNYNEPFHVSTAIATLDYVTGGRAGLLAQTLSALAATGIIKAAGHLRGFPEPKSDDLQEDAADAAEVIRLLWDSWEDDAVIRDPISQRFVDGKKLHYIDYKGRNFKILGPSIVPRPPQGQPVIASTVRNEGDLAFAAAQADLIFIAADADDVSLTAAKLREAARSHNRQPRILLDVAVSFSGDAGQSTQAAQRLAERLLQQDYANLDGFRFIAQDVGRDLEPLLGTLIPALTAGLSQRAETASLREHLHLPAAFNRYSTAAAGE